MWRDGGVESGVKRLKNRGPSHSSAGGPVLINELSLPHQPNTGHTAAPVGVVPLPCQLLSDKHTLTFHPP